jgi:hypothetical protein
MKELYRVVMVFVKDRKGQTDTDYITDFTTRVSAQHYVDTHHEHFTRQAKTFKNDSDIAVLMDIEHWKDDEIVGVVSSTSLWAKPLSKYELGKMRATQIAVDYQITSSKSDMSYGELAKWSEYFTKLGKRYGLLKEFRENGII